LRSLWEFHPADYFPRVTCPTTVILADSSATDERTRAFMSAKQRGADAAYLGLTSAASKRILWFTETAHDIPLHRPGELADGLSAVSYQETKRDQGGARRPREADS
jgi:hypothetical protein